MLLSPTTKKEKRESAPPSARSWIASRFSFGESGSFNDPPSGPVPEQQQQRRASAHSISSTYSTGSSTTQRPLPDLPVSRNAAPLASPASTSAAVSVSSEDSIKVPVADDAVQRMLPNSQVLTSNRLHPNNGAQSLHPLSPQLRALSPTTLSGGPGVGSGATTNEGRSSLEYQSSISSNNSSSSNAHRGSLASLRHHHQNQYQLQQQNHHQQPMQLQQPSLSDLRGDNHTVTYSSQEQQQQQNHTGSLSEYGPSFGQTPLLLSGISSLTTTPATLASGATFTATAGVRVETGSGSGPFAASSVGATAGSQNESTRQSAASQRVSLKGINKTPSEDSLHHHLSNLLQDNNRNSRPNISSSPSVITFPAQLNPVSPWLNATLSHQPSSINSGGGLLSSSLPAPSPLSSSTAPWSVPNSTNSASNPPQPTLISLTPNVSSVNTTTISVTPLPFSSLPFQSDKNSSNIQPYFPPPPPALNNSNYQRPQPSPHPFFIHNNDSISTSSPSIGPAMATSITATTLEPYRSRRHSSGADSLSIQTQHLTSIRKGPSTADVSGPHGNNLFDRRPHLKNSVSGPKQSTASHLPPRQSPNHLSIPQKSLAPRPVAVQGSPLYDSPSSPSQQRHHSTLRSEPPGGSNGGKQHYNPQHRHQKHQQHHHSTVRQAHSPKSTSPSSLTLLDRFQDRSAMALMQRYLTNPDDPDSEADISMQIMISQAAVDSKGFEILVPATVENVKRHHATLSSRIAALSARLSLESKIREAAQSLLKLHKDNKKLARQASDHLEAANRKVDQVATELWKLTQLAADLQRTLLQHTSGVLALGVVRLEDQGRRERELHAVQLQHANSGPDHEEQIVAMSRTISSLEADAFEAQQLLEDKDRAIGRLMKQLEHQQDLFIKLDEQQQKTIELARTQQMSSRNNNKGASSPSTKASDAKVKELTNILSIVSRRLHKILQLQQQQQHQGETATATAASSTTTTNNNASHAQHDRKAQKWSSETTLLSKTSTTVQNCDTTSPTTREDSMSTIPSEENTTAVAGTPTDSGKIVPDYPVSGSKHGHEASPQTEGVAVFVSLESLQSVLDVMEEHASTSHKKMTVLEGELGLLRRQSVVLSQSRANSVKIKASSTTTASSRSSAAEDTIRAALEKSLKDALLEKEMARQELENERQRWHDDQNHRIRALEESLVAVEEQEHQQQQAKGQGSDALDLKDSAVLELRRQLREAIDEIDVLSLQQQASLKSMRQLFNLLPDSRRKSHLRLYSSHQQLQQQIATNGSSSPKGPSGPSSGRESPASNIHSSATYAVGFSMEALIVRVKDLVARSQQLEQDNMELRQHLEESNKSQVDKQYSGHDQLSQQQQQEPKQDPGSTWILKSDLERLQASAGMIQLLDKELELLKQHTDMLLDENARLADLAAATTTGASQTAVNNFAQGRPSVEMPSLEDALDEFQEIIRAKDTLLQEQEEILRLQERALKQANEQLATPAMTAPASTTVAVTDDSTSTSTSDGRMSEYDLDALEEFRDRCRKLEEQVGEMSMIIAALESMTVGPGSGSQILQQRQQQQSNAQSSTSTDNSWFSSGFGAVGSLSFGSLTQRNLSAAAIVSSPVNTVSPDQISPPLTHTFNNSTNSSQILSPTGTVHGSVGVSGQAAVAGATAALRKEFRRVMHELREEKDKTVRKEVEERRRLERTVRQLRRDLQALQN